MDNYNEINNYKINLIPDSKIKTIYDELIYFLENSNVPINIINNYELNELYEQKGINIPSFNSLPYGKINYKDGLNLSSAELNVITPEKQNG